MLSIWSGPKFCRLGHEKDENGRKISKRIENTGGKGEIIRNKQTERVCRRQFYID